PPIGPQRNALDFNLLDFVRRRKHCDMVKSFPLQRSQRPAQILCLLPNDMRPKRTVGALPVAFLTYIRREIEHDRGNQHVVITSKLDERDPIFKLDACRVDNRQTAGTKPLTGDVMQDVESVRRRRLIVIVIRSKSATKVRRQYLRGLEMAPRKCRLAAS